MCSSISDYPIALSPEFLKQIMRGAIPAPNRSPISRDQCSMTSRSSIRRSPHFSMASVATRLYRHIAEVLEASGPGSANQGHPGDARGKGADEARAALRTGRLSPKLHRHPTSSPRPPML
jgi:hypothetical protein